MLGRYIRNWLMSIKKKLMVTLLGISSLLLAACNDEGGDSNGGNTTVTGLSSLVGVYDWSDSYDDGTVDEWYLGIDSQGYISDYDYFGDSYDMGGNCYYIDKNWEQLTHVSGNVFDTLYNGEVTITKSSSMLTVTSNEDSSNLLVAGGKVNIAVSDMEAANCESANSTPERSVRTLERSEK